MHLKLYCVISCKGARVIGNALGKTGSEILCSVQGGAGGGDPELTCATNFKRHNPDNLQTAKPRNFGA